ncbi:unnamed protein product [Microthlaspi erraticum]|uniref:Endonuclease/exonuclease/phosphatase domain-containing protein n=1 Tax=Microthlaspi erraticum TaxID=1685480 RepID=A0A6D2KWJ1_9BRAS|nr:unnamed protein product [Microthlaspi erraticum]
MREETATYLYNGPSNQLQQPQQPSEIQAPIPQPINPSVSGPSGTHERPQTLLEEPERGLILGQQKKRRGRPPSKAAAISNLDPRPSSAGPSKRKTKNQLKSPLLRMSPLSRVIHNRNTPQRQNQNQTRGETSGQRQQAEGLPPRARIHRLKELQKTKAPDIIFLMETKNDEAYITKHLPMVEYSSRFLVPPHSPGGGGLALFWKSDINLLINSSCDNYIDTTITYKGNPFITTFTYGEPDHTKRKAI